MRIPEEQRSSDVDPWLMEKSKQLIVTGYEIAMS